MYWIKETIKILLWVSLALLLYTLYNDGVKPYREALSETKEILAMADIPYQQRTQSQYHQRAKNLLIRYCNHGVHQSGHYDFRCASGSPLSYLLRNWLYSLVHTLEDT